MCIWPALPRPQEPGNPGTEPPEMDDLSQPPCLTDDGESGKGQGLAQGLVLRVPSSFPDFTLPSSPQKELGKNLQRHPWGRQLEGRGARAVMVW